MLSTLERKSRRTYCKREAIWKRERRENPLKQSSDHKCKEVFSVENNDAG
jgi:hypothetical protein